MIWYLAEHWRGNHSLGISYWLNGTLGGIFVLLVSFAIGFAVDGNMNPVILLVAMDTSYAVVLAVLLWQFVGLWRSARHHKARTGRKFWATVAQCLVVLSVVQGGYIIFNAGRQSIVLGKIIAGTDPLSKFDIKVAGGKAMQIGGYIAFQMVDRFDDLLKRNPGILVVDINSPGGRVGPARHIRDAIVAHKLNTASDTLCASACTIAFMAGKARIIAVGAKLGFHQYRFIGLNSAQVLLSEREDMAFFRRQGVTESFIAKAFATPSSALWEPTYQELMDAHVVTHVFVGGKLIPIADFCRHENCAATSTAPQWLQSVSAEVNQTLPKQVDQVTRLDRTLAGPGKNFSYRYTLLTDARIDFAVLDRNLTRAVCRGNRLKALFDRGVTVHWLYLNRAGEQLYAKIFAPTSCAAAASSLH